MRIKVHAAALNFFDLLMLVGKYQMRPELPFTVVSIMMEKSIKNLFRVAKHQEK